MQRQHAAESARATTGVLLVVLALSSPACGGAIQPEELRRGVETIGSLASEGTLLADGVARDRTRSTFTRVQARTLAEDATHEAEKLSDASPSTGTTGDKAAAVALAQDVADALGQLQVAPGDEKSARSVRARLMRASDEATRLARKL